MAIGLRASSFGKKRSQVHLRSFEIKDLPRQQQGLLQRQEIRQGRELPHDRRHSEETRLHGRVMERWWLDPCFNKHEQAEVDRGHEEIAIEEFQQLLEALREQAKQHNVRLQVHLPIHRHSDQP